MQVNTQISQKAFLMQNIPQEIKRRIDGTIKGQEGLLEEQSQVLGEYYIYLVTECGWTTRYNTYLNHLNVMNRFAVAFPKPFNEITKEDIKHYFFMLSQRGIKESTLNQIRMCFRCFFRFLYQTEENPPVVSWITLTKRRSKEISPDQLLTKMDIRKMAEKAILTRDKALVTVLYESAARRAEILSCNISHVTPDKYGIQLKLPVSKTKERTVRLIESTPFLQAWINDHPYRDNPDAPLFVNLNKMYGKRLGAVGMVSMLKRAGKAAGIHKKVNPHGFRHARLDALAREGFNERDLKIIAGWSDLSDMPSVYLHYGWKELDKKLLLKSGRIDEEEEKKEQDEKQALTPIACPRCRIENAAGAKYCHSCGMALNLKDYMDDQETIKNETDERLKAYADIMADPEKRLKFEEFKKMFFS